MSTISPGVAETMMKYCQTQTLSGTDFKDGTLLTKLGQSHVKAFRQLLPAAHKPLFGKRTWGSLCSGSEGARFVAAACERAIGEWNTASGQEALQLEQLFACEIVPLKRTMTTTTTHTHTQKHEHAKHNTTTNQQHNTQHTSNTNNKQTTNKNTTGT